MNEKKSYFDIYELGTIALFAFASAALNTYLPIRALTEYLGIPGPAAGMAILGGFIFVFYFWVCRLVNSTFNYKRKILKLLSLL
ncbi:MAG: hypothetical protein H0M93_02300 [Methanophagales archaeon]|nr:hypothetical protein [Methanophagales archaeon]